METVHMRAHTTPDGRLLLDLPTSLEGFDVDVTVTVQSATDSSRDALGWPTGFWERFAGSIPDFPDTEDVDPDEVEPLR